MRKWILLLAIAKMVVGQDSTTESTSTTEDDWGTVTYNPGQECLPYDGSIVPDCTKYVDPVTKQPYYKEHSNNCSRFWECGPAGETCLVECPHCGGPSNSQCEDRWALTFDPSKQYPVGPVCVWPVDLDCGGSLVCDINKPEYECCANDDCCPCPGTCYCAFNDDESSSKCVQEKPCTCENNSDCLNFDGTCNVPPPHDNSCTYCEANECKPGCIDNDNCPEGYVCNDSHLCESDNGVCVTDPECIGYDVTCNVAHDNCFFCGDDSDCASSNGCCPGCHDSALNCAYPYPICNQDTHRCGCTTNDECNAPDICDNNQCVPPSPCAEDWECDGWNATCNEAYNNCFYCGTTEDCGASGCCPGCLNDSNCPYPTPICDQVDHRCGCVSDDDCQAGDFCDTDKNLCVPQCKEDNECEQWNNICNDHYDNCNYCGAPSDCDDFGCCPGCGSDLNCEYPKPICRNNHKCGCNVDEDCEVGDECNQDTHICQAKAGSNLLVELVFTSAGCDGCTTEGINMMLTGSTGSLHPPECQTVNLDHPGTPDYVSNGIFKAVPEEVDAGWNTCYRGALEGEISNAEVTWTGEGTWSPKSICFGWTKADWAVTICDFPDGTTLENGESATLMCKQGTSAACQ